MKKKLIEISILISNFNNKKFVIDSIKSVQNQKFNNYEIIVIDDRSTDGSYKLLKNLKNIKLIQTTKKKNHSSYNQMNAYVEGFKKSCGRIICFLDSDDLFKGNKLEYVYKFFKKNKKKQILFDMPIIFFNKKKNYQMKINKRSKYLIPWSQFPPQSCISIRRNYLKRIIKKVIFFKFPNTWLDFRILCQTTIDFKKIDIISRYLTIYRQNPNSQIINYKKKFSKNWWKKREEAHLFQKFLYKKNKVPLNYSIDRFFTKIINKFID